MSERCKDATGGKGAYRKVSAKGKGTEKGPPKQRVEVHKGFSRQGSNPNRTEGCHQSRVKRTQ